jgi:hypothetical protein
MNRQSGILVIVHLVSCVLSLRKPSITVLDQMDNLLKPHN